MSAIRRLKDEADRHPFLRDGDNRILRIEAHVAVYRIEAHEVIVIRVFGPGQATDRF